MTPWRVIAPKLEPQHEVLGLAKCGVFVKLMASARTLSWIRETKRVEVLIALVVERL